MKHHVSSLVAVAVVSTLAALSATACSSSTPQQDKGLSQDPGSTPQVTASDVNPYGVAYPTTNIGHNARKGSIPGNVMQNFKLVGYKNADQKSLTTKGTLTGVSLADFYDPDQKLNIKVIHISVASVWCGPCNEETDETAQVAASLRDQGVVFFQALNDGPVQGTGATKTDLDTWLGSHKVNFTDLLDPDLSAFGEFFDAAAVPFNANLDARSMEILSAGVGAPPDVSKDVLDWVKWVGQTKPSYAPPAAQ